MCIEEICQELVFKCAREVLARAAVAHLLLVDVLLHVYCATRLDMCALLLLTVYAHDFLSFL